MSAGRLQRDRFGLLLLDQLLLDLPLLSPLNARRLTDAAIASPFLGPEEAHRNHQRVAGGSVAPNKAASGENHMEMRRTENHAFTAAWPNKLKGRRTLVRRPS